MRCKVSQIAFGSLVIIIKSESVEWMTRCPPAISHICSACIHHRTHRAKMTGSSCNVLRVWKIEIFMRWHYRSLWKSEVEPRHDGNTDDILHGRTPCCSDSKRHSGAALPLMWQQRLCSPADFLPSYYHVLDLLNKQINHARINDVKTFFQRGGGKKAAQRHQWCGDFFPPRVTPTLRQPSQRQGTLEGFDLMRYKRRAKVKRTGAALQSWINHFENL